MPSLIIDTSGPASTVIVAKGARVVGSSSLQAHPASRLHEQIRALLADLGLSLGAVREIGVLIGPGGWTGLNIGVTAAKTLAQVLGLPLVAVPTLNALVAGRTWRGGCVWALLDAGRSRVYQARYDTYDEGRVSLGDASMSVSSFDDWKKTLSGCPLVIEYGRTFEDGLRTLPVAPRHCETIPPAGILAAYRHARPGALRGADLLTLSPVYLQASLAERDAPRKPPC